MRGLKGREIPDRGRFRRGVLNPGHAWKETSGFPHLWGPSEYDMMLCLSRSASGCARLLPSISGSGFTHQYTSHKDQWPQAIQRFILRHRQREESPWERGPDSRVVL